MSEFFAPIPVDDFEQINKSQIGATVPDKVPPTEPINGIEVHCGPILRLLGTLEQGQPQFRGSIMLVTKGELPKISFQIGPADSQFGTDIQSGGFPGTKYHEEAGFEFWRFAVELPLAKYEQRVRYLVNGIVNAAHAFFIPAATESMNVVSYLCNGFSLGTDTKDFQLSLWLDVLRRHGSQHYHVMLGGGDQLYCDSIKLECPLLKKWLELGTAHEKRGVKVTPEMIQEFEEFYLNAYLEWFGKGYWKGPNGATLQTLFPLAMAQIPCVNIFDDHDIIDGFGSYKDRTMAQEVFSTIGNIAYRYYMLFQHQTSLEEPSYLDDKSWIIPKIQGPFIKQPNHSIFMRLGQEISLLGLDCRTERKLTSIISDTTYKTVFSRLEAEIKASPETKHLLVMLGVPIMYPRLVWLEKILTLKLLRPIRGLAARGVMAKGLVNEFDGGVEVLDDLNDHWCSKHHKRERNFLIKSLIDFGAKHGVRITILSGDVHLGCISRLKTKMHTHVHAHLLHQEEVVEHNKDVSQHPELDPRLVFNVISSAIVNAPPPDPMATLLNKRSTIHRFDAYTDEDMVPLFTSNPDGTPRENLQFLNKRNWSDLVLVKQSPLYRDKVGETKFPGALFPDDIKKAESHSVSEHHVKYPILESSLVTTLHFEAKVNDFAASTAGYEVIIPDLQGKYQLEKTQVKHL